jgi:5'-nucleotidase
MYGCVILACQNLAVSGANQVLLNLLRGGLLHAPVVVFSPVDGPLRHSFLGLGAVIHIGEFDTCLAKIRDIRLVICNTIMTAHNVAGLAKRSIPHVWILHEWWPKDVLERELMNRRLTALSVSAVEEALESCQRIVLVCESQRCVYNIKTNSSVIYVGVPHEDLTRPRSTSPTVRYLCMGVVCPRKNQVSILELFKCFAGNRTDVRLDIVGARYVRDYEIEYIEELKRVMGNDDRISLHPVTEDPCAWYRQSDVLLMNSLNEVTPLVICEAMLAGLPVITSDIAGIPEMLEDGRHGFLVPSGDDEKYIAALHTIQSSPELRERMGRAGRMHALQKFTLNRMIKDYAKLIRSVAPITVLVDMDGVVVDWDQGFRNLWSDRSPIIRDRSYIMQECVPLEFKPEATRISIEAGFFASLPPYPGAIESVKRLSSTPGFSVFICTSPLLANPTCIQDKLTWINRYFGPEWLDRLILTRDKTTVRGDVLVDDKPDISGSHHPTWIQIVYDQPYNRDLCGKLFPFRMHNWGSEWLSVLLSAVQHVGHRIEPSDLGIIELEPEQQEYCHQYGQWRQGSPKGAKDTVLKPIDVEIEEMMQNQSLFECDDFEEMFLFRKTYRQWRMFSH